MARHYHAQSKTLFVPDTCENCDGPTQAPNAFLTSPADAHKLRAKFVDKLPPEMYCRVEDDSVCCEHCLMED